MRGPLVSVVIPAFNSAKTIGATLFSVINQDYRTLEIIIIDDGSTDDTEAVVGGFSDRRIRYEKFDKNRGISAALNYGISLASSEIIARMDADDVMRKFRLSDQMAHMLQHNLAIVGGGAEKFGSAWGDMWGPRTGIEIINGFLINNPFIHPTVMLNRKHIEISFREDFPCQEDYELWSRCITDINCENLTYPVIRYRVSNTSNQSRLEKRNLTKQIINQFCDRFQIEDVPIDAIVEGQLSGMVRYEDYILLKDYAVRSERARQPGLGWLQEPLVKSRSYRRFANWHLKRTCQLRYFA